MVILKQQVLLETFATAARFVVAMESKGVQFTYACDVYCSTAHAVPAIDAKLGHDSMEVAFAEVAAKVRT